MKKKVFIEIEGIENIDDFRNELTVMLGCYEDMSGEHEIKIHVVDYPEVEAWTVTADDFAYYDIEGLSEEKIEQLLTDLASAINDFDCIGEDVQVVMAEVAERWGLAKKSWENLTEKLKASEMCRKVFDKSSQTEYTFDAAIEEVVALWQVMEHSYPEEYYGKERMWADELADVLANKE